MDSSNSGSFQSSSGGAGGGGGGGDNEEYDSRTQSISSFLNPSNHFNQNLNHLLQPPSNHHHPPPTNATNTFFNPSSSPFSPNPNPVQDLSSIWAGSSIPSYHPTNPNPNLDPTSMDSNMNTKTGQWSDNNHSQQVGVMTKNPKKRTRASRRAPTTVLTTDTTNFRQMVQEFTGIPTAPFTAAPFSRRLDLFNPLRPSVQKIQHAPPYLNTTTHNMVENSTTTSNNYNIPPSTIHDFQKQPSTLLDLQNPMLSFQSLLQQNNVSQQGNELSGFQTSKRWRSENDKMESFEGVIGNNQNIGGSKLNSGLENVGDQVQGNEGSWICPSS